MKKILFLASIAMLITFTSKAFFPKTSTGPHASFDKIWVDYDKWDDGIIGMKIHVKFTAYEMKDMDAFLAIYYLNKDKGNAVLKDKNDKYVSSAGDVALYKAIKPAYDPAVYEDLELFMPYSELDLDPGVHNLTMEVKLIYKAGGVIQELTRYDFEYTKPESNANGGAPASIANAEFEKLWIDYDVKEGGQTGMRIHVKFTLLNMQDVDSYMAIYFEKKNGEKVMGKSLAYKSSNGQAAVFKSLKPGYNEAVFSDLQLFMPYNEFVLGSGKFELNLNASIILKNGDIVKQLTTHEFLFTQ